jgi:hypothetical protein
MAQFRSLTFVGKPRFERARVYSSPFKKQEGFARSVIFGSVRFPPVAQENHKPLQLNTLRINPFRRRQISPAKIPPANPVTGCW